MIQLTKRVEDNAKVQEGENPNENPIGLIKEFENKNEELAQLIKRISKKIYQLNSIRI